MYVLELVGNAFLNTLLGMAPWLLFGFFVAGMLSLFFTPAFVGRYLGKYAGRKAILWAVLLGVPLPLCSCGVLPVAVGLRREGASRGAVAAFLSSTPQTGVDSFFATYALLGGVFAWIRPLVALITGLTGGWMIGAMETPTESVLNETPMKGQKQPFGVQRLWQGFQYGYGVLFKDVAGALLVGLVLSALIVVFLPDNFFELPILRSDWAAFPLMLLIGMPMYVCSVASIPVAMALILKGISPGAALIFLIVGPALNGASLTTLLKLLGKRSTVIYLIVLASVAVLAGFGLNYALAQQWVSLNLATVATACTHETGHWLAEGSAIVLMGLLVYHLGIAPWLQRIKRTSSQVASAGIKIRVGGMQCDHCRGSVMKLLQSYPGVTAVQQVDNETFIIQGTLPETLAKDIENLGFKVL